jgi:hypothetical protein
MDLAAALQDVDPLLGGVMVTSLPCETSPRSVRVVRKIAGGNSGRK